PNPASNVVRIEYGVIEPLAVTIDVLNLSGQVVATVVNNEQRTAGLYTLTADISGLSNGVYQVRMTTQNGILSSRLDIVR
ncbi:MAG: T9SS type A sorting domain-containing protein, partial [Candidatus Kapabacteria bacterium]|nr:T9SS type A sorting domain-containing protein [Candidatus Kapabacteria bacterium]